ncbi:MAG: Hpt domain-containing protein [Chloroflexi bacterium]|nr:Hpt domain-containing protein [Chloroflexota bacterium]
MSHTDTLHRPPLNTETIQAFVVDACGGDMEIVLQMVDFFLNSAAGLMAEMESSLAGGNLPVVRRAAHSLKSSSRMFSADTLANLCALAEINVEQDGGVDVAELLPQIQAELTWLVVELPATCRGMME